MFVSYFLIKPNCFMKSRIKKVNYDFWNDISKPQREDGEDQRWHTRPTQVWTGWWRGGWKGNIVKPRKSWTALLLVVSSKKSRFSYCLIGGGGEGILAMPKRTLFFYQRCSLSQMLARGGGGLTNFNKRVFMGTQNVDGEDNWFKLNHTC